MSGYWHHYWLVFTGKSMFLFVVEICDVEGHGGLPENIVNGRETSIWKVPVLCYQL